MMTEFFVAIGLAIAIEGFVYALFPNAMKRMMAQILEQPPEKIRSAGLIAAVIGVGLIWLIRS